MEILGIDIGGSGIKGAPVNTVTGELLAERLRFDTPQPATPGAVIDTMAELIKQFQWSGAIGVGFPAVIKNGVVHTAANVDPTWIGYDFQQGLERQTGCAAKILNDADAAGIAEITFGAGKERHKGMIMMITLGTGVGTAAFIDGALIPNLELGHMPFKGVDAETIVSDAAREREALSWKKWGRRVGRYLHQMELLLWPDLFIIGGGVSKKWETFAEYMQEEVNTPLVPAEFRNNAGIVGAALSAAHFSEVKSLVRE